MAWNCITGSLTRKYKNIQSNIHIQMKKKTTPIVPELCIDGKQYEKCPVTQIEYQRHKEEKKLQRLTKTTNTNKQNHQFESNEKQERRKKSLF